MIRPSKEVVILAAGLLVAAGGAFALLRRDAEEEAAAVAKRTARVYDAPRPALEGYAVADLKAYWLGVDVTGKRKNEDSKGGDLDPIPVPPPPSPVLAAPPLRPWPVAKPPRTLPLADASSGAAAPAAPANPAAPAPTEAGPPSRTRPASDHLLPPADFEEFLKLPDPPDVAVPDRRDEKVRDFDVVYTGSPPKPNEGKLIDIGSGDYILIDKRGIKRTIRKSEVKKIERACTVEEQYAADSQAVKAGDAASRLKLGAWCLEQGMIPEATAEYAKALEAKSGDVSLALELALLYRRAGRFEDELKTLRAAAERGASSREKAWLALADFHRAFGLLGEALEASRMASKVAPGDPDALVLQAELELALGQTEKAAETAAKAVDRSKGSPRAVTARASALFARGELDRAKGDLDRILAGSGPPYAPAANLLGVVQFIQGAYAEAVKSFALAAKTDPAQVPAITNLGILYLLAGKGEEARQLFQLAAGRDPADSTPLVGQALVALTTASRAPAAPAPAVAPAPGEEAPAAPPAPGAAAKALLEKALAVDPLDAYAEYAAGMAAYALQIPAEADRRFQSALRGAPDSVPVLYALGSVHLESGRGPEAEVCFAHVVERGDATPEEQMALAAARAASGEFEKASADLQRLQVAYPRMVHVWNILAYIDYMHHRKVKDAIAKLKQALACDPNDQWALVTMHKIVEDTTTRITEDDFNRPDADEVGKVWVELENTGVDVKIADQACRFSGTQRLNDWADTAIEREVEGEAFKLLEADFDYRDLDRAVAGIRVTYAALGGGSTKSIVLARDDRGRFVFADVPNSAIIPQWKLPPAALVIPGLPGEPVGATGKPIVRLKIVAPPLNDDSRNRSFDCYVNNERIGTLQTALRDQAVRYTAAVFVRAMKNTPIEFTVDNIRIAERKGD